MNDRTLYQVTSVYNKLADVRKESEESESVMLEVSITAAGYTGGGTQVREAGER